MTFLTMAGEVLRDPRGVVERSTRREVLADTVPKLLLLTIGCAAVFGGVVGSYRGGLQVPFAAVKMPLVLLAPLLAAVPATGALYRVAGVDVDGTRLGVAGLVAVARTALVAAGMAPVLWLLYSVGVGYHLAVVALAGMLVLAGIPGLLTVFRTMPGKAPLAALAAMVVLGVSTAQVGWVLRPFVARPTAEVTLLRPIEGDISGTLLRSTFAAGEIYMDYEPARSPWRGGE